MFESGEFFKIFLKNNAKINVFIIGLGVESPFLFKKPHNLSKRT